MNILSVVVIPFLGTVVGASTVLFARRSVSSRIHNALLGFAAGVMVAASVWSLIIPSLDLSESLGVLQWMPATIGIILGMLFLLLLDSVVPHQHLGSDTCEGPHSTLGRRDMLMLAVTLHNIPEGMAVGVVVAGSLTGQADLGIAAAVALAMGMALQNIPEGAIISLPIRAQGGSRLRSFGFGALSGIVEPISAVVTILLVEYLVGVFPYLLAAAAGAMVYVVVEELIPEAHQGKHSNIPTIGFAAGFVIMMVLDTALG